MVTELLALLITVESGIVAGVFFAVAVSVIPALATMPPGRYIEAHRALGEGYHPVMPIIVNSATLAAAALIFLAPSTATRWIFAVVTVLLLGVQGVSHLCNVPINRRAKAVDPDNVPDGWDDPRTLWRNWHLLRTALAFLLLVVSTVALISL
ncbi:anthrone oxygenase family protein [Sinosporangium siamense]|uniref:DUF1772 domain-containing protein n=1 Tax=Sinosporangium siamense TaxID=1367973 RepID=A0A919RMB2_9ACTN|nr:DUF1772 domain-containing protein [Sinosporangium siamense]GII95054.1 hypothetical protein Ssi02_52850 [Sinosporangium siamense]